METKRLAECLTPDTLAALIKTLDAEAECLLKDGFITCYNVVRLARQDLYEGLEASVGKSMAQEMTA